eukprot:COSAG01_NODE_76968_length_174_cov_25.666667_1_plen_49_part_01
MNNGLVNHTEAEGTVRGPRSEVRGPRFYDNINNEERQGPRSPPRSEAEV